jgi:mannose-6-phosphate isomerase-like protein (cupin superfamily)
VALVARGSVPDEDYTTDRNEVLMVMRGHWRVTWAGGTTALAPGDTMLIPPGVPRRIAPAMSGEASLFRVRTTDDPAGPTWTG